MNGSRFSISTFNLIIHSNTSLSNTQRFQYLWASLIGDANAVISSLELSDTNYDVAWSILRDRYDNKRMIVQIHVKAIMDLPAMAKENSIDLWRRRETFARPSGIEASHDALGRSSRPHSNL